MFILTLALLSVVVALARGGRLTRLALVPLRHPYLVVLGLLLQIVVFSPLRETLRLTSWVPHLYVLSMLILALWITLNFRLPGLLVIGLGLLLNTAAIAANDGYMPAAPHAVQRAGITHRLDDAGTASHNNSILAGEGTRLYYLTDIFAIPKELPLANVFSLGDVFITVGAMYFLQRVMTDPHFDPS